MNKYLKLLLLLVLILGGIGYWQFGRPEPAAKPPRPNSDTGVKLSFIHPLYGYKISLPYHWRGNYLVTENGDQSDFWFTAGDRRFRLFSIAITPPVSLGTHLLGGDQGQSFYFVPGEDGSGVSAQATKMVSDLPEIEASFRPPEDFLTALVRTALSQEGRWATTSLDIVSFETLTTEESTTTSIHYLWYLTRNFVWQGTKLDDRPVTGGPARATFSKESGRLLSIEIPTLKNRAESLKKLFPPTIRTGVLFLETSVPHISMLEKLSAEIDQGVENYFGGEPILTKTAYITGISSSSLSVKLAEWSGGVSSGKLVA
ncbi:MAG: hypothetical protein NTY66_00730, partial [Candidatus Vogelbacteria bacterium]|nr:hypothetical protein [Candidatus Vogelbacteria bacterium]